MSNIPESAEVPVSCVKVSPEEAKRQMQDTTEAELAKLAELMKTQKFSGRKDVMSESESNHSEDDDSDDEDYIPAKRKRVSKAHQDVESKMYIDNQKLWQKIHKYGIELNRTEKELHYMQLELNNKTVECNDLKNVNKALVEVQTTNTRLVKTNRILVVYLKLMLFVLLMTSVDYAYEHTFFPSMWSCVKKLSIFCHNYLTVY